MTSWMSIDVWSVAVRREASSDEADDSFDDEQPTDRRESTNRERVRVTADPELRPFNGLGRPFGGDRERGEWHLEEPQHHHVEADDDQHGDR